MNPYFSILVVCLNPGDKLKDTLESVGMQSFRNFEVILKDGGSGDGSLACAYGWKKAWEEGEGPRLRIIEKKDGGIYDAMNQAAKEAEGRYLYFLNCGDRFYGSDVLEKMQDFIESKGAEEGIFYGDIYERLTRQRVASNPRMDPFGCYRNVPCHQACFYSRRIFREHPFDTGYLVRADYEQFLWCFFVGSKKEKLTFAYQNMLVADYEGGGFSETKENRKVSAREHREITGKYMTGGQRFRFRLTLLLTLAPLRSMIAENEKTAGLYNRLKEAVYAGKGRKNEKDFMDM